MGEASTVRNFTSRDLASCARIANRAVYSPCFRRCTYRGTSPQTSKLTVFWEIYPGCTYGLFIDISHIHAHLFRIISESVAQEIEHKRIVLIPNLLFNGLDID